MKKLARLIGHHRTLVFLDLEGTQQSHELIALAAIKADLNEDLTIKKLTKGNPTMTTKFDDLSNKT